MNGMPELSIGNKRCVKCGGERQYHYHSYCKLCLAAYQDEWERKHPQARPVRGTYRKRPTKEQRRKKLRKDLRIIKD